MIIMEDINRLKLVLVEKKKVTIYHFAPDSY